jgi:plastocyanin
MAFDKYDIVVPAGQDVTVVFENKDSVSHNFAVYEDDTASKAIFVGEPITGPQTIDYQFVAPEEPGAYFFRCDIHPTMMTGALIVQGTTT